MEASDMDTEYKKRGYLSTDFRLFHLKDKEGTPVGYHYHEFYKLLLLRSGCGGYTVDGKRYSLEAGDIVFIDIASDFSGSLAVNAGTDLLITLSGILCLFLDPCWILPQNFTQRRCDRRDILLRLTQLMGVQVHIFHADGGCQNIHIPVVDIAPLGTHCGGAGLISQSFSRVVVILRHHELVQLGGNG